jgi:hypothetical protein
MELTCKAAAIEISDWFTGMTGLYLDTNYNAARIFMRLWRWIILCTKLLACVLPHHYNI